VALLLIEAAAANETHAKARLLRIAQKTVL
jgi:hypothetical protein